MKSLLKVGYAIVGVLALSFALAGCSGGDEGVDMAEDPGLKDMPKVPDEAAKMNDGPGGGNK